MSGLAARFDGAATPPHHTIRTLPRCALSHPTRLSTPTSEISVTKVVGHDKDEVWPSRSVCTTKRETHERRRTDGTFAGHGGRHAGVPRVNVCWKTPSRLSIELGTYQTIFTTLTRARVAWLGFGADLGLG